MTAPPFHYRLHGLLVSSDFRLDEADPCAPGEPDVLVRRAAVPSAAPPDSGFRAYCVTLAGEHIEFKGIGRFRIAGGARIDFDPDPQFDLRLMALPLLGPVFALLLHRRGLHVLHGSAVEIGGEAHVFLGDKGAGKSTTAAALLGAGFRLICDDVVALERTAEGGMAIHPAFPAMKLDDGLLAGLPGAAYRILEPNGGKYTLGKHRVRLRSFRQGAVPLGRIHCLARGSDNHIESFGAPESLRALIRFAHHPRLGGAALAAGETAALFARAAALTSRVKVDRLTVKDGLAEIGAIGAFLSGHGESGSLAA